MITLQTAKLLAMVEECAGDKARAALSALETPTYTDTRGAIEHHLCNGVRYNTLTSKAGTYRSGDIHHNVQYDVVLQGSVTVTTRHGGEDWKQTAVAGDRIMIPANVPHLFYFEEDTVMVEWWDGPFAAEYFRLYRDIVDEALAKAEADAVEFDRVD